MGNNYKQEEMSFVEGQGGLFSYPLKVEEPNEEGNDFSSPSGTTLRETHGYYQSHQSYSSPPNANRELRSKLLKEKRKVTRLERKIQYLSKRTTTLWASKLRAEKLESQMVKQELDHQIQVEKLQGDNRALKHHIDELSTQLAAAEVAAAKNQLFANSSKVSDDEILLIWGKMAYTIEGMVNTVLTGRPSEEDLEDSRNDPSCVLRWMSPSQVRLLQNDDIQPSIVEKYIWLALVCRIFGSGPDGSIGKSWAGKTGECFSIVLTKLDDMNYKMKQDPADLFRWKAEGAKMIDEMIGVDKAELQKAIDKELAVFSKFLPKNNLHHHVAMTKLSKGLGKAFDYALQLQSIFMKSKAIFYPKWTTATTSTKVVRYSPGSMAAEVWQKEPLDEHSIVNFCISPSLIKLGTADGDHYEQSLRLVKARVICN